MTHIYKYQELSSGLKAVFGMCLVALITLVATNTANGQVFISEYIEGSSNNKALEIFNGSGDDVNLENYRLYRANNGSETWQDTLNLTGTLAAGAVYVIANPSADQVILDVADTTHSITFYNGDDALALAVKSDDTYTIIDSFGKLGEDPGSAWDVAGVSGGTGEHTLFRKSTVTVGNPDSTDSFGTTAENSEWIVSEQNDFSNIGAPTPEPVVNITFTVNTATFFDTVGTNHKVYLNGAMKGESFVEVDGRPTFVDGETLGWDTGATAVMTNIGGDYWQATYKMFIGDTLLFKYRVERPDGSNDDDRAFDTAPNPAGWDTRGLVATQDTVLPVTYFNNVGGTHPDELQPFTSYDDSVSVFFRVNVSAAIQQGSFDPETDQVAIVGTPEFFRNSGDWSSSRTYYLDEEDIPEYATGNENAFYSGPVVVANDSLSNFGDVIYKFVLVKDGSITAWDDRPDGNRELTVPAQDSTVQWVFFKDEAPSEIDLVDASVRFNVNVGILEGLGYFSSGVGDKVVLRGADPIGWGTSEANTMSFDDEELNWGINFPLKRAPNTTFKYKYYIQYDDSRTNEESPNFLSPVAADGGEDFGYEEPVTTGGADRIFEFGTETEQSSGSQLFNGLLSAAIINADDTPGGTLDLTFEIDMGPAMDAGLTQPFNPDTDSVYLEMESKYTALTNGFTSGGQFFDEATSPADYEFLRFEPTGETNIYALTMSLQFPTLNDFGFVVRYGQPSSTTTNMVSNGAGFDAGRRYYQFIEPTAVVYEGFDPFIGEVYDVAWPATYQMPRLTWKEDNLPFDVQPDYAQLATSTEDVESTPNAFSLDQNYPNPFNPTTNISFNLPNASNVTLAVYNLLGQRVATLINGKTMTNGVHSVAFDARALSSGVYIYRLEAGSFVSNKRMTLIK